jgi:hypothetical protein
MFLDRMTGLKRVMQLLFYHEDTKGTKERFGSRNKSRRAGKESGVRIFDFWLLAGGAGGERI